MVKSHRKFVIRALKFILAESTEETPVEYSEESPKYDILVNFQIADEILVRNPHKKNSGKIVGDNPPSKNLLHISREKFLEKIREIS